MKKIVKAFLVSILRAQAWVALALHKPRIVLITGSVGKTSTKDAIAAALSESGSVRKSEKSFNSDIGIPLAILALKNPWSNPLRWIATFAKGCVNMLSKTFPRTLVLEVGADRPRDISSLSSWLLSDIVVLTQFAKVPVHIEYFESREGLLNEKLSLLQTLKPGGTIVLNADDAEFPEHVRALNKNARVITYGIASPSDVSGSNEKYVFDKFGRVKGFSFRIEYGGKEFALEIEGVIGSTHVYPCLAGFAVGIALGLDPNILLEGLKKIEYQPGRMRILSGIKKTVIIDDTYNASPIAVARALETLEKIPSNKRKIAVLGDMLELGEFTREEHERAGERAASFVDILIVVGKYARYTAEGALRGKFEKERTVQCETSDEAGARLKRLLNSGDTVLVKGSQGNRMERAVLHVIEDPEKAGALLVRQDAEWKKR
jgi:UDP-N-acetylmuramoyl-tripeptide--D-alanyl-D-alanine ligase